MASEESDRKDGKRGWRGERGGDRQRLTRSNEVSASWRVGRTRRVCSVALYSKSPRAVKCYRGERSEKNGKVE
jgi:hypothetical protein